MQANGLMQVDCRFFLLSTEDVIRCRVNLLRGGIHVDQLDPLAISRVPFVYRVDTQLNSSFVRGGLSPGNYVVEGYPFDRPYPAVSCAFTLPANDGSTVTSSAQLTAK